MEITALPFNQLIGIERSSVPGEVLTLPEHKKFTNHVGTVHASALLALAEATSGECLVVEFGGLGAEFAPVVRRIDAKFRGPARGSVHSKSWELGSAKTEFIERLKSKGRAFIEVPVEIYDASGDHVLTATVEWFVARRAENPS